MSGSGLDLERPGPERGAAPKGRSWRALRAWPLAAILLVALHGTTPAAQQFSQPAPAEVTLTRRDVWSIVESLAELMATGYVDSAVGAGSRQMLLKRLRSGAYRGFTRPPALIAQLVQDVQSIIANGHFNIVYAPPAAAGFNWVNQGDGPRDEKAELEAERQRLRPGNFGVTRAEILEGNIGYVDLTKFDAPLSLLRDPLASAFDLVQNTDALIVDLRRNPGGNPECVQLVFSYFLDGPAILATTRLTRTDGRREEYRTYPDPGGRKYLGREVYVLIGPQTGSGAEMLAYQMKHYRKGTLVGARTAGAAHSFDTFQIGDPRLGRVMVMLPNARMVDELTRADWEKAGVSPDVESAAEGALQVARRLALESLMAKADRDPARAVYRGLLDKMTFVAKHGTPRGADLEKYAGRYGMRRVFVENDRLKLQRDNGPLIELEQVGDHTFELNISLSPRPRVRFDMEGEVAKAIHIPAPGGEERVEREMRR